MKRVYTHEELGNPLLVLRRAGYSPFKDPQSGEESFILRLTSEFYPRFHLYVEPEQNGVSLNLHLDQKKPSYGQGHAHAGEYEGSTVEKELGRIHSWVNAVNQEGIPAAAAQKIADREERQKNHRPWWKRLLG